MAEMTEKEELEDLQAMFSTTVTSPPQRDSPITAAKYNRSRARPLS